MKEVFLQTPNLPETKVTLVAVAQGNDEILRSLEDIGIRQLVLEASSNLSSPVAKHPDMNFCHVGGSKFFVNDRNHKLISSLQKENARIKTISGITENYPSDVALNIAVMGDNIVNSSKYSCKECIDYLLSSNKNAKIISTKQGYAKCSTAIVNDNAVITSDVSIAKALKHINIDVLFTEYGDIEIEEYPYGFIGGCCGLIDKSVMAFTGDLNRYKCGKDIIAFLKKYKCEYVCLSHNKMLDIGGIIPLKQAK